MGIIIQLCAGRYGVLWKGTLQDSVKETMATFWSTMTYFLLPPAVVLYVYKGNEGSNVDWNFCSLLLLTIPFPFLKLNRAIVRFADFVFSLEIGTIKIFHLITVVSFVVLAGMYR